MIASICNLLAAILCTAGSALGTAALFISAPSFVNRLAGSGAALATLGGMVWIVAAVYDVRSRRGV